MTDKEQILPQEISPHCFGVDWSPVRDRCLGCEAASRCLVTIESHVIQGVDTHQWISSQIAEYSGIDRPAAEILRDRALRREGLLVGRADSHKAIHRWLQERANNPRIAAIEPGQSIIKLYKGEHHEVICRDGHWEHRGQRYSTLSSVVGAIAGYRVYKSTKQNIPDRMLAVSSGAKFFCLDKRPRRNKDCI